MNEINTEQKIDFIYETLKKQEWRRKWNIASKWIFRILILAYIYYFLTSMLPSMIDSLIPDIPSFWGNSENDSISDTAKNMLKDYLPY
jgi:hypothetical protein